MIKNQKNIVISVIIVLLILCLIIYRLSLNNTGTVGMNLVPQTSSSTVSSTTSIPSQQTVVNNGAKASMSPSITNLPSTTSSRYYNANGCFSYVFSNDLSLGSTGSDVVALQEFLISQGFPIVGIPTGTSPTGYFGNQTLVALEQYQKSVGLTPSNLSSLDTVTRAYINNLCTSKANPVSTNTLILKTDPTTPSSSTVRVSDISREQYLGLPVIAFDLNSQNVGATLRSLKVNFALTGIGQASMAYLYQGSTLISSTNVVGGVAVFASFTTPVSIQANTNMQLSARVDVLGVTSSATITASILSSGVSAANTSYGLTAPVSGSAQGNTITITQ